MDRPPAPKPRGTHFPHPGSSHHLWTVFVLLAVALCRISSLLRSLRGHVQGHAFGSVAGKDHAGAGTACRSSKSIALSPKSIFTAKAASAKFGKEKPRGNTTARRSRCKGKDRGKGSGAKLDEHRAMTRHHGQAEGDGAVRHNSRSTERRDLRSARKAGKEDVSQGAKRGPRCSQSTSDTFTLGLRSPAPPALIHQHASTGEQGGLGCLQHAVTALVLFLL